MHELAVLPAMETPPPLRVTHCMSSLLQGWNVDSIGVISTACPRPGQLYRLLDRRL